eukprot:GHVN01071335.1.p1 GENE.GHVN01071335.1~~GHVN01071335.1.p1  ORF type:complete len:121 (+),score=23.36 GHVN01071335.1:452-814(+)
MTDTTQFEHLSDDQLVSKVLDIQQTLVELSLKVDSTKAENASKKENSNVLREYISNLMAKMNSMPNLGTSTPSPVAISSNKATRPAASSTSQANEVGQGSGAVVIKVNDHIGELTMPAGE